MLPVTLMTTTLVVIVALMEGFPVIQPPHPHCIRRPSDGLVVVIPSSNEDWARDGIQAHNDLRARHGVPPLSYRESLCNSSQWVANKNLNLNRIEESRNMTTNPNLTFHCGENLACYMSSVRIYLTAEEIVRGWYEEVINYNFSTGQPKRNGLGIEHFTQIVWKASRQMCMSYSATDDGTDVYIAAHYHPPGNVVGQFTINVFAGENPLVPLNLLFLAPVFVLYVHS